MNKVLMIFFAVALFLFSACGDKENDLDKLRADMPNAHIVKVTEHFNASDYTYMKVEEKEDEYWIAVPHMDIENEEILFFTKSMEMKNFYSKTLDRTFESILFVDDVSKTPHSKDGKISHPNVESSKENIKVEPLKDGYTVAKIFAEKSSLAGKEVKVKGIVVKYNQGIMGRNWIHIQDGTGEPGSYDLVVTTTSPVEIGETIVAEGTVVIDKDFGSGYKYSVLMENAEIKSE